MVRSIECTPQSSSDCPFRAAMIIISYYDFLCLTPEKGQNFCTFGKLIFAMTKHTHTYTHTHTHTHTLAQQSVKLIKCISNESHYIRVI